MSIRKSIRNRRTRRNLHRDFDLQLTSMMDILVIILVFLLKSYSTSTNSFSTIKGIKLPYSKSQDLPRESLHLIVTPSGITFDGKTIVSFVPLSPETPESASYAFASEDLTEDNMKIWKLFDALTHARQMAEENHKRLPLRDSAGNPLPFDGVLAIQADQRVVYDTLRKIMFTAGLAQFRTFRFLALRQEQM
jgi:biopolymer transport protein ExbD